MAAGNARERILNRLRELSKHDPVVEYQFTMQDAWSKKMFLALLQRYELRGYRYRGQRRTTVMVRAPKRFLDGPLWPQFQRASAELRAHLDEVANSVIERALDGKVADVEEREQPQQALPFAGPENH